MEKLPFLQAIYLQCSSFFFPFRATLTELDLKPPKESSSFIFNYIYLAYLILKFFSWEFCNRKFKHWPKVIIKALGNIPFGMIFNVSDFSWTCRVYVLYFVLCYIIGFSLQCCLFGELSGLTSNSLFLDPLWAIMKL